MQKNGQVCGIFRAKDLKASKLHNAHQQAFLKGRGPANKIGNYYKALLYFQVKYQKKNLNNDE